MTLPTYIINLKRRTERLNHIIKEFKDKDEFELSFIEAVEDKVGAAGLWKTMIKIIEIARSNKEPFVIICEDDHYFTENYNKEYLIQSIEEAETQGADILCGGISGGYNYALPLTKNRFWVDRYWCNQFIIIYAKFYQTMLNTSFDPTKKVDQTLSGLTANKMVIFPFISHQKYFGYSDVTKFNNENEEWVMNRFKLASDHLSSILKVYHKYYT